MRKLSAHALAKFQESAIEPVLLIKIFWQEGLGSLYGDRKFVFETQGIEGKLISIGEIDDVVNIDNSSSTAQVSIVLDDTIGPIKNIFNTSDIHKVKVQLLQWCTDLPLEEAFIIFTGQISSPIEWKEGDRTLSFDVVSLIEDREVGFSVENGKFPIFPSRLIGQAWPIIFGQVIGVPALNIIEAPSGIIAEGLGIIDTKVWEKELFDLNAQRLAALRQSAEAYKKGIAEAYTAGRYKGASSGGSNTSLWIISDDPKAAESHDLAADNYYAQANAFADDANNISRQMELKLQLWDLQKSYDKKIFKINSLNMPQNTPLTFKLGSATYTGIYNNGYFSVNSVKFPEDFNHKPYFNYLDNNTTTQGVKTSDIFGNGPQQVEFGQKFTWVDAGTEIHIENVPISYVVSIAPVNIQGIYAYRRGVRVQVPESYYTITHPTYGNTTVTLVTLNIPLTARTFFNGAVTIPEGWDSDNIEVDCTSLLGSNTIDILTWIITLFTKFSIDTTSFNATRALLTNYPMNFALLDKKNVVELLHELAFQARCSIWLNDETFFIRYLPVKPTPVDTINDSDILVNSLSVTCTDTENIITSYTATWKPNLFQKEPFKVIYQYNIPRYGFKEESYNFFAYNQETSVQKSAEFWMVRKSNTFKIVKFKTALNKINIETFDPVTIDFEQGLVSYEPVVGTVLKATYNIQDNSIDMEVWLPIRFGEMVPYDFAEPFDVSKVYPILNDPNIKTDNPFELAGIFPQEQYVIEQHTPYVHYLGTLPPVFGRYRRVDDAGDSSPQAPVNNPSAGWSVDPARIGDLQNTNNYLKYKVGIVQDAVITDPTNAGFPGIVKSIINKAAQTYNVDVYFYGFNSAPVSVVVKQFQINSEDTISPLTPVEVKRLVWRNKDGFLDTIMWMQAPIWQTTS